MGFDPSVIFPDAGDVVVFQFRSGLHSVLREYEFRQHDSGQAKLHHHALESTFTNPCTDMTGGYDSGVITVSCIHIVAWVIVSLPSC